MRQHLIRGRGRPTEAPEHYSQLYLDLDTNQHWISIGIFSVDDWHGPMVLAADLDKVLSDFANGIGRPESSAIVQVPVRMEAPYGRHVKLDVNNRDGRFYVITEDTGDRVAARLFIEPTQGLDQGTVFSVLNSTLADFELDTVHDIYRFAGRPGRTVVFYPGALMNFKLLNVLGDTRYWLVWGDTETDAELLNGMRATDIINEVLRRVEEENTANNAEKLGGLPASAYATNARVTEAIDELYAVLSEFIEEDGE